MASTYLSRTPASAGNRKTYTISAWIKRGVISSVQTPFSAGNSATEQIMRFESGDTFYILDYQSAVKIEIRTSRVFRDPSAWYHIVVAVDTTQATSSDRVKIYVNGVQETSFGTATYPAQDTDLMWNSNVLHAIGRKESGDNEYFDGQMAHVHFIDGTAYDASAFGETESTSGIWKPKTAPSVTYGTNGFFLKFQDSSSLGDDSSGNTNDFTLSGSGKQILDTPSNVFATLNPLDNFYAGSTFSNGNNTITTNASNTTYNTSTFGISSGKWYWEYKFTGTTQQYMTGIASKLSNATNDVLGYQHAEEYALNQSGSGIYSNSVTTNYGSGDLASGDIISVALDLDNNNLYFAKNGQWGSGSAWDQTFSNALAYSITDPASTTLGAYFVAVGEWNGSGTSEINMNFGNGYFGTTAVSSAENDDAGYGKFEYDVPAGYYALCTKNINNYG